MKQNFWHGKKKLFFILLYLSDVLAFIFSAYVGSVIMDINLNDPFYIRFYLFALLMLIVMYSNYKLYNNKRNLFDDTDFMNIVYSNIIIFVLLAVFTIMFNPREGSMFLTLLIILVANIVATTIGRVILNDIILIVRKNGYDVKKTIFFGEEKDELVEKLKDRHLGYDVISITNKISELKKHIHKADIVFLKMESIDDDMLEIITKNDHINWKIVSSILNLVIEPVAFDEFKDYPIINVSNKGDSSGYKFVKRGMDILLSGIALVVLSPLLLIIALLIKTTMPGPVFFKQKRLGKNLKPFTAYKFRSMKIDADKEKVHLKNEVKGLFKMKNDPRITPFGKILRRTCLDELPQIINIFKGDMAIVGPRPHLKSELPNFSGWRMARFNVKPGLTGLWQVNGRHELNFDKAVLYDIYYVKHMSFLLDITIIMKTIPAIILNKGKF